MKLSWPPGYKYMYLQKGVLGERDLQGGGGGSWAIKNLIEEWFLAEYICILKDREHPPPPHLKSVKRTLFTYEFGWSVAVSGMEHMTGFGSQIHEYTVTSISMSGFGSCPVIVACYTPIQPYKRP